MTALVDFSRESARHYLQSIVFVDDEIYSHTEPRAASPAFVGVIPSFPSPYRNGQVEDPAAGHIVLEDQQRIYHPKHLVESFAKEGMVCGLYQPAVGFSVDRESELYKLCERADAVILDWDLYQEGGENITPLIANLVDQSQGAMPHHVRLCVVYTATPDLFRVGNKVYEKLLERDLRVEAFDDGSVLIAGATRICVFGKPDVVGRSEPAKALEVREADLASAVINEFAKMHVGILPSIALRGLASIRRNSKRILDKFSSELDGPFLLHRALVAEDEEAFDQLSELIAEESLAVMDEDELSNKKMKEIASEVSQSLDLNNVHFEKIEGRGPFASGVAAERYLIGGWAAISGDFKKPKKGIPVDVFHSAMGCNASYAEKRLAALFCVRTKYRSTPPSLGFGCIVRLEDGTFAFCLMPACDSMRLKNRTSFPFWTLKEAAGVGSRGLVVQTEDGQYRDLYAEGKPRDMFWMDFLVPSQLGVVTAEMAGDRYFFVGEEHRLEWIARLKPEHAQRIAHDIGLKFSRVGLVEAEWLRLKSNRN